MILGCYVLAADIDESWLLWAAVEAWWPAIEVLSGGVVEKFIGDAVMAVFGAPASRGDDERAARASLRVLDAIQELNKEDPAP
jgi:hypothetical protein